MNDGDIKISIRPDCVEVDLCSEEVRKRGGSAVNQYVKTPRNTEVYFGNLHARVTMFDVGICVVMDPRPGEWHDGTWARGAAIAALTSAMSENVLARLLSYSFEKGRRTRVVEAKSEIRKALGV